MSLKEIMTKTLPTLSAIDRELFYRRHENKTLTDAIALPFDYDGVRVSIAPKLRPLFEHNTDKWTDIEYFLLRGGRGSGKSETIGQLLVLIARSETTRILCTREIQNSIDDSVKKVLEEWIEFMGFSHEFEINAKTIKHKKTGTDFVFMGIKAGTDKDSIKSLKGIKYVWVEEAQTLSKNSWDKLDPTIRIDGRKFFFSYNPRTEHDVVDGIKSKRKAHLIHINYNENPFLPMTMLDQAKELKAMDFDSFLHIWEGRLMAEDASSIIMPYSQLSQCVDLHKKFGFSDGKMFGGFDIADGQHDFHDRNSFTARAGSTVHKVEEWQIGQVYQSVRKVHQFYYELGFSEVNFDAVGMGVAAKSEYARMENEDKIPVPYDVIPFQGGSSPLGKDTGFVKHGPNVITNGKFFKNVKAQLWWNGRLRLQNSMKLLAGHKIDRDGYYLSFSSEIKDLDMLFSELSQATYKTDSGGRIQVDKAPGIKEIQVDGKSKLIKSPNKADSTILSFARDLQFGLRAHGEEVELEEDIEFEYEMPDSWESV